MLIDDDSLLSVIQFFVYEFLMSFGQICYQKLRSSFSDWSDTFLSLMSCVEDSYFDFDVKYSYFEFDAEDFLSLIFKAFKSC